MRIALTKEEIQARLDEFDKLFSFGYRRTYIYEQLKTSRQRIHQLRKRLAELEAQGE